MLMIAHNTGMNTDKNKQSLFDWQTVQDNPPRPQIFIDLDIKDNARQHINYQAQLLKMSGGFTRKLPTDIKAPYKKPVDSTFDGLDAF
jgi:hypothetical protein